MATKKYNYVIKNIHTNERFPGIIYADLYNEKEGLILSATLKVCANRLDYYVTHGEPNTPDETKKMYNILKR